MKYLIIAFFVFSVVLADPTSVIKPSASIIIDSISSNVPVESTASPSATAVKPSPTPIPTSSPSHSASKSDKSTVASSKMMSSSKSDKSTVASSKMMSSSKSKSPTVASSTMTSSKPTPGKSSIVPSPSSKIPMSSAVPTTHHPTTHQPTTHQPTTAKPDPEVKFFLNDTDNHICVAVDGKIKLDITVNASNKIQHETFPLVQKGSAVKGHCFDKKLNQSEITITWGKVATFTMKFNYTKDEWFMEEVDVEVNTKLSGSVNAKGVYSLGSNDKLYQGNTNTSYTCNIKKHLELKSDDPLQANITIKFEDIKIQPYVSSDPLFHRANQCPGKSTEPKNSSVVPIAVGCALAGLIVIVLIAYLIGRRKNQRGYQQV